MVFAFAGDSTITKFFAIFIFTWVVVGVALRGHPSIDCRGGGHGGPPLQRSPTAVSQNIYRAALSPALESPTRAARPSAPKSAAYSYQKANRRAPDCPASIT